MDWTWKSAVLGVLLAASGCGATPEPLPATGATSARAPGPAAASGGPLEASNTLAAVNRITWGVNASTERAVEEQGLARYLEGQLHPPASDPLPPEVTARIASLTISREDPLELARQLAEEVRALRRAGAGNPDDSARKAYQQRLTRLEREAATRSLLRDVYSRDQLKEQMTWFWMNHFNVFGRKADLRVLVADYEERAIRPHALGRFRDLLGATLRHPAMLRYLDNARNAAGHLNENYARELLELHTLGVDGGYTQHDVQELARVLTGVGVNLATSAPRLPPALRAQYVHEAGFEFNPARHDYGAKTFLGHAIAGRGMAEVDQVLDILARSPATARFVSGKIARYFVADDPPPELVTRMAAAFTRSDGDIATVLRVMFDSPEFARSLGSRFKDPVHYVISAARLAWDGRPMANDTAMLAWLGRLGEALYGHPTPDGYPSTAAAWSGSGQMATRFEVARAIAGNSASIAWHPAGAPPGAATRNALEQAASPRERLALLLSSPEFMYR